MECIAFMRCTAMDKGIALQIHFKITMFNYIS